MKPTLASFKRNQLWHAVCVGSLTSTWLIASSVVQASDLQIYAVPEAGKKTIVMMLDTSGSMAYYDDCERTKTDTHSESVVIGGRSQAISYKRTSKSEFYPGNDSKKQYVRCSSGFKGYSRLSRLQDGMFALLNSTNSDLPNVSVGLGNYSSGGDNKTGQIVIPAKPLGAPGSEQRNILKVAIAGLSASGSTPTSHAYAEAASYLMGTSTYAVDRTFVTARKVLFKVERSGSSSSRRYAVYECNAWNDVSKDGSLYYLTCKTWKTTALKKDLTVEPGNNDLPNYDYSDNSYSSNVKLYYRYQPDILYREIVNNTGIAKSKVKDASHPGIVEDRSASDETAKYTSPLPAVEDRQSCDGQGVYVLSDGEANNSSEAEAGSVMKAALTSNYVNNFSCTDTLIDANGNNTNAAMGCMASFAKKLFNPETNPTGVSIKTAFVGFGGDMSNLNDWHVKSSCQWSSRAYNDPVTKTAPNDRCSPGSGNLAIPRPTSQTSFDGGYGNGGFFIANTDAEVTNSVIQFIRNLGATPLAPLTTGTIAVPYDSLDPKSLETTGYLRAMEPNPASSLLTWRGNLKKYESILTGANAGAFGDKDGSLVYDSKGNFEKSTKDIWNGSVTIGANKYSYNDGGNIEIGGVRWNMPMPALGQSEEKRDGEVIKYTYSSSGSVRNFYTDAGAYDSTAGTVAAISGSKTGAALLKIPTSPTAGYGTTPETSASHILAQFGSDTVIKEYPALLKRKLLNYLGFNLQLTTDVLPATLTAPDAPYFSMGGIIHSYPVQLTYSGTLDENGDLSTTRERSILFGTMEGGLHIVNAKTGVEESVFVPAEILNDTVKSKALSPTESDAVAPSHGMDGAWVADPAYKMESTKSGTAITTKVTARRMNVYGGMRMGGNSYFGMDVLDPKKPKLLFRINKDTTGFSDMGQSWSKPVLANVRYGSEIKRVMIIGGGYDQCYENPSFKLGASGLTYPGSCNGKTTAEGNAVYIVDAQDGSLVWSATYDAGADDADGTKYLKHSIVSRISTLDRDADGLIDHLYFGDLGGQIFRIDLDNKATAKANLGKRVVRLANLASAVTDAGYIATSTKTYLDENAPRFYEPVTVTIHDQAAKTFILVGAASGDRSTPLDVSPLSGREGMLPGTALSTKPVNNAYGIIDNDFMTKDLITGSPTLTTVNKTMDDLVRNPQVLPEDVTSVISRFFNSNGEAVKHGWYRSLSSVFDGTEKANNTFRREGGMKAFEEPVALTGHLMVSVYDPEGTGVSSNDPCNPRIVGETDWQKFCLPFGACINSDGSINSSKEKDTGSQWDKDEKNSNILGSGIRGITLVGTGGGDTGSGQCGRITMAGNVKGTGIWQCTSHFIPTRWYERYR
ncbi:PilC/PilY family type IV pilus protein [Acinetobacter chinensis]|uniref:PilC/PilY family type IV pilus protein n=1 Tax=Acinetobacter chinensis TaxID=2004650 RepID=A0ABU3WHK8_9GAMM|nr:PilC/PilY family type IV pilus protein [Acinetobacter chinensis]MDV2469347.1 PilC/PilY family type IV pilus protein [Acinetobacter chinensis]